MSLFNPNYLPSQPNPALASNSAYGATVLTATGNVAMQPGDWVIINPNMGFLDPVSRNLFQVSGILNDGQTIQILYSVDGINYSSINLSSSWVMFTFRMQAGS